MTYPIGTPCTLTLWTDRVVCRVIRSDKVATIIQTDVFEGGQWEPDPRGKVYKVTLRKNLVWKLAGLALSTPGGYAEFGVQNPFTDPSF